jgi:ribosomal protein S18 acetylase RimI-like enzyme
MFYEKSTIDKKHFDTIKRVTNEKILNIFQKTFDNSYQEDDPQNPYGSLGDYLKTSERAWKRHHKTKRVEYFIAYKSNKPASVSTLTNHQQIGYISNVGSLRKVRGEGFGKATSLYAVMQSQKHKNLVHVLATEEGTYPNEFYKRIGFKTRFSALGYVKD